MLELKLDVSTSDMIPYLSSQSHHAGIETFFWWICFKYRPLLPIAPCWNWNVIPTNNKPVSPAPNRTMLELKHNWKKLEKWKIYSQSHHAGIETYLVHLTVTEGPGLPIAPCWNWNMIKLNQDQLAAGLPIAPCWNWNKLSPAVLSQRKLPPNRTMLELKQSKQSLVHLIFRHSQSHHAGIETGKTALLNNKGVYSQSHHAGIETSRL